MTVTARDTRRRAAFVRDAALIYRLRTMQSVLDGCLRRLGPPTARTRARGALIVQTLDALRSAELVARSFVPFDPTGL